MHDGLQWLNIHAKHDINLRTGSKVNREDWPMRAGRQTDRSDVTQAHLPLQNTKHVQTLFFLFLCLWSVTPSLNGHEKVTIVRVKM